MRQIIELMRANIEIAYYHLIAAKFANIWDVRCESVSKSDHMRFMSLMRLPLFAVQSLNSWFNYQELLTVSDIRIDIFIHSPSHWITGCIIQATHWTRTYFVCQTNWRCIHHNFNTKYGASAYFFYSNLCHLNLFCAQSRAINGNSLLIPS